MFLNEPQFNSKTATPEKQIIKRSRCLKEPQNGSNQRQCGVNRSKCDSLHTLRFQSEPQITNSKQRHTNFYSVLLKQTHVNPLIITSLRS